MKRIAIGIIVIIMATAGVVADTLEKRIKNMTKREMQSVVEFLGHDLLEGRAPGTRGGNVAEIYMRSLFKWMDLEPGEKGKYMQPFILKGFTVKKLDMEANGIPLKFIDDVVGTWVGKEENFNLESEALFLGFGITAELWKWDDYKKSDVNGKIVIVRVNDPGMYIDKIFEGNTLTYYGRWTYHIEEAARRGAAGILLIHTDESAGYDWNVVKNSWTGEEVFLESDLKNNLKFRGWIKESSLKKILDSKKINLEKLYKKSLKRKFKAVPLGFNLKVKGKCDHRDVLNHNVVARIPGKSKKRIVLSAHLDHLGMDPGKKEDKIFNGAIDNGSAVAAMMMTAKVLKEFREELHYTVVVLACHSEEAGLLGSKYYAQNIRDKENVVANINFESTPVWGKASDIMAVGARFSTLEDMLKKIVKKEGLDYSYFSMTEQGFFYRSDQFSFARYDIPAIWISAGENDDSGQKKYPAFWKTEYHTVRDEYDPQWSLEGLRQTVKMTLLLIDHMNKTKEEPRWKGLLTFPIEQAR